MHLVLMTRGIQQQVDLWKQFMQTQMFWWKRQPLLKDKDGKFIKKADGTYERGKEETTRVQGALRPIQLYEYVFPSECLPEVLGMMDIHRKEQIQHRLKAPSWMIRKAMGLKPVPVIPELQALTKDQITQKYIPTDAVATYAVGIREDPKQDFIFNLGDGTQAGFYQEGL